MSGLSKVYERNEAFAATFDQGGMPVAVELGMIMLTCMDPRVDPSRFAGLELGDAFVLRTAGARVTDAVVREVAMSWMLMAAADEAFTGLELAIVQHTRCGMAAIAQPDVADKVTARFRSDEVVNTYAITDPTESLLADVARLSTFPHSPRDLVVSGHIYDIDTGQLTQLVPPARLG